MSVYTDEGYFGDNCATVMVGEVDEKGQKLVRVTAEALTAAIDGCGPGSCLSDIGATIHAMADANGFESVEKVRQMRRQAPEWVQADSQPNMQTASQRVYR